MKSISSRLRQLKVHKDKSDKNLSNNIDNSNISSSSNFGVPSFPSTSVTPATPGNVGKAPSSSNESNFMSPKETQQILVSGKYSDVTINVFGMDYKLHKVVICNKCPFFDALLCPPDYDESENVPLVVVSDTKDGNSFRVDLESEANNDGASAGISVESENPSAVGSIVDSEDADQPLSEQQQIQQQQQKSQKELKYTGDIGSVIKESDKYYLNFGNDSRITKESFELMIQRLYQKPNVNRECELPNEMMSTGAFFGVSAIIDSVLDAVIESSDADPNNVIDFLKNPTNYSDSKKLGFSSGAESNVHNSRNHMFDACKCFMLKNGWQLGVEKWDGLPIDLIIDIITKNYFFVPNEFDRALFIIKLIERRIQTDYDESVELKRVLNEEVILSQISNERLFQLFTFQDVTGMHYLYESTVENALNDASALSSAIQSSKNHNNKFKFVPKDTSNSIYTYFQNVDEVFSAETPISEKLLIHPKKAKTKIPPCRISIEFTELERLNHGIVISSEPFFYAGSYYSVSIKREESASKDGGWSNFIDLMYIRQVDTMRTGSYNINGTVRVAEEIDSNDVYLNETDCLGKPVEYLYGKPIKSPGTASATLSKIKEKNIGSGIIKSKGKKNNLEKYKLIPPFAYIDPRPKPVVYLIGYVVGSSNLRTVSLCCKSSGVSEFCHGKLLDITGNGSDEDLKKLGSIKVSFVLGLA
ncbi:unnamed protein product [Ambrosiozyma monospora]|uniref:Unnamed protein product n=1 Tax=Ambrosiozyma monospora TaxID=43982 RepID=A0A9W6YQX7_AMBMO|nr:unnamed protein product [Ambrosiozyma monospora]